MSDLERVTRWADAGAHWRVRRLMGAHSEIELRSCDQCTLVEVIVSDEPELARYVADHGDSDDPTGLTTRSTPQAD